MAEQQDAQQSAAEQLRAFEDEKLGKDAPRIDGAVEQGSGSLFERLTDADKSRHGLLKKCVETAHKVAAAYAAWNEANAEYEAAAKACAAPAAAADTEPESLPEPEDGDEK